MATLAIFIDKLKFGNKGNDITDNIPPAPPTIWADYTATNSATIRIYGISEPETMVFLMRGDEKLLEVKADKDGKLVFEDVMLKTGKNDFWSSAFDNAGNNSHQSRTVTVSFTDKGPDLTLEKPTEEQKYSGQDNPIEVKGKTAAGVKVYINTRLTITDGNGNFVMKLSLNEGENILKIRAVDEALNETVKEIKVFYQP